jgi:hypothetical protein
MKNRRPVFRFIGEPGQTAQQCQLAFLAQEVFFRLVGNNGNNPESINVQELVELGLRLNSAGILVESPVWFANALAGLN